MYDLPQNTMLTYCSNPMFDQVDFSAIPVSALAEEIQAFQKASSGKHPAPETDALSFYFMNHAFHVMKSRFNPLESLSGDMATMAEMHINTTNAIAKRLFFYSIIVAVEEARFLPNQEAGFYDYLHNRFGMEFSDYVENGFKGGLTDFGKLDMSCGEFAAGMMAVFTFGRWQPGFGGRGWAPIAGLVSDCVNGAISFESFADQAFSLCHNNGSMFNKGHLYSCYTQFIYTILDIQDSGQIPQWIDSHASDKFISPELKRAHKIMSTHFPDEMTGKVDNSLIKGSQAKREQKAAAMAKKNAAMWNQQQVPENKAAKAVTKQNNVLMGGLDIFNPKRPGM